MSHALRAAALVLVVGAACRDTTAPGARPLVGRWATDAEPHLPSGTFQSSLTFRRNGRFAAEVRMYGIYPGQPARELSAYTRTLGAYRVEGERLTFAADSVVTWDRFYGAGSRPQVRTPHPYGVVYDDARYAISGRELTLHYLSYPLDAPEPTTARFRRAD
jgi:hypothetical protein